MTSKKYRGKKVGIRDSKLHFGWVSFAVLATFVVYIPALSNGFLNWDDPVYVTQNPLVTGEWSLQKLQGIITEVVGANHHPITVLSLAIDYSFFGDSAFAFHLINVLFHVANVALLYWFMWLFTRGNHTVAFLVALLFGIHPMHVESVAWVSERKDVLYVFFFLAGLIAYLKYLFRKKTKFYYLTLLFFLLSVFSKPAAVVFPIVLILIDFYLYKKWRLKMLQNKMVFFVFSLIAGILTIQAQEKAIDLEGTGTLYQHFLYACYGFNTYLAKLLVPIKLSALYPYPIEMHLKQSLPFVFQISPLITLAIVGASIYSVKYFKKWMLWGVAFYAVTVALVLQLVSVGSALMADRYTYLPYVGIFFVLARLYDRYVTGDKLKSWVTWGLAVYVTVLGVITWERCKVWENGDVLFSDVLEKFPTANPLAYYTRGNYYFGIEEYEKAASDYSEAVKTSPTHYEAWTHRADTYKKLKRYEEALADYNEALKVNPNHMEAVEHRAGLYLDVRQPDKVLEDIELLLSKVPNHVNGHNLKAGAYFQKGAYDLGLVEVNKALQINPQFPDAFLNRAILYSVKENHQGALKDYDEYLKLEPTDLKAYLWRGIAHRKLQQYKAAKLDFDKVIEAQPNNGEAYRNRALVHEALGQMEAAAKDDLKAKSLGR